MVAIKGIIIGVGGIAALSASGAAPCLILRSENDFDETGEATLDQFGDCIAAYVTEYEGSSIRIESVSEFEHDKWRLTRCKQGRVRGPVASW